MSKEVYEYDNPFKVEEEEEIVKPMISLASISRKKLERHELRFPTFRFILADDWLKKLGNDSFCLYLELFTMADRTDTDRDIDKLPTSMKALMKRLGISKGTFYKRIKPLYEYGFIDFIEFTESKLKGQKPINIIVFEAPWNEEENIKKPLVKLRSWEERTREQFPNALKGGKKKQTETEEKNPASEEGISNLQGSGKFSDQGSGKEFYPTSGKENEHNNVLNNINNALNPINNSSNVNNIVNNKGVSNSLKDNVEEELVREFREKASDAAFNNHYASMRSEHKLTKEGFMYLVNKIIEEKIESGKHTSVYNVEAWIAGALERIANHRTFQQRVRELQERLAAKQEEVVEEVQQPEEEQYDDVPSDEEILALFGEIKGDD